MFPDKESFNSRVNLQERNIKSNYPEFYQFLIDNRDNYPGNTIQEQMYMFYNGMHESYKCEHCGKPTKFISFHKGYRRFCCGRCTTFDPKRIEKTKLTWKNNYGENYYEVFNKKGKQTKLERYGDENYNNIDKAIETRKDLYSEEFINNRIEKSKQTCLEKYGVENPMQSEVIQERVKQTNLKKYGVEWCINNPTVRDKNELSRKQFYIKKHNLIDIDKNGDWICKCPHPDCNICEEKSYKISSVQFYGRKQMGVEPCTNILPIYGAVNTSIESFIRNLLTEYNIDFKCNVRNIIPPKELVIYIPSKNIAIECN